VSAPLLVDVVVLGLLVLYLVAGLRRGAVAGLLSLLGLVGGAALGLLVVPALAGGLEPGVRRSLLVLAGIVALAALGQLVGDLVGRRGRRSLPEGAARAVDSALGAAVSVVVVAVLLTVLLAAGRGAPVPALSRAVAASAVAQTLDRLVPDAVTGAADGLARSVAGDFPRAFAGFAPEIIVPVAPPDPAEVGDVAARVGGSTVKVSGPTDGCGTVQEGSGFVVAPGRVVTNAHVVAGVPEPVVQVLGQGLDATVVLFDPERDLAVLAVPDLSAAPLPRGADLGPGDSAAVLGYPLDEPYTSSPARVRQVLDAAGEDIYGDPGVTREVYSLYATVRQGNSGGPVVDPQGRLVGVVFAASLDDPSTGYALTLAESAPVLDQAAGLSSRVSTGPCSRH
jgi:S1-C subfamily serine protease